jgi:hypothetical protein
MDEVGFGPGREARRPPAGMRAGARLIVIEEQFSGRCPAS